MKKIVFALIFAIISYASIPTSAYDLPQEVKVALNASGLAQSINFQCSGGMYTSSKYIGEDAPGSGTSDATEKPKTENGVLAFGETLTVKVRDGGGLILNGLEFSEDQIDIHPYGEYIKYEGKGYRGYYRLVRKNNGILVINCVGLEDYLYGVVGREMSESFPIEALKAQAICARNYTVMGMNNHSSDGYNLCNGVHCQAYGGVSSEGEKVRKAVDETKGTLMYYKGNVVQAYYFSCDGGYTEDSENVWVSALGYLRGVEDDFENPNEASNYNWKVTLTAEDIKNALAAKKIDIGDITNVEVTEYSSNRHAVTLKITGTKDTKTYTKDNIRSAFSAVKTLNSTLFTIKKEGSGLSIYTLSDKGLSKREIGSSYVLTSEGLTQLESSDASSYTFEGRGWGHSVGMSQWGAKAMADKGYTFDEILKYYFTDVEIG